MIYEIFSARGGNQAPSRILIGQSLSQLDELIAGRRVVMVTDENLKHHYPTLVNRFDHILIPDGESNKILATIEYIHRQLLALGADRHTYIVGMGGGIVTDMTGFAASTFMRGLDFGFIATSLLAQVDASVGGKNGVNLDGYKNIIGTFNQPDFVICDITMLSSLPSQELRAGMSEAIKSGIIGDAELFRIFESHSFDEIADSKELITEIVRRSVEIKARIVEADFREGGLRKMLNLGHTFGHSIEKNSTRYVHGQAVAIGMAIIASISEQLGILDADSHNRILRAIENMGLPTAADEIAREDLIHQATLDKKRIGGDLELILIEDIGRTVIYRISIDALLEWGK